MPQCGMEQHCSVCYIWVGMNYEVLCFSVSGCNPASHKICKNNAIITTVYKVSEVNLLVKVKKDQYYEDVLFSVCDINGFRARET